MFIRNQSISDYTKNEGVSFHDFNVPRIFQYKKYGVNNMFYLYIIHLIKNHPLNFLTALGLDHQIDHGGTPNEP